MNTKLGDSKFTKQIMDFQKATFDNTFSAFTMFQDQAEKAFNTLLESRMWPFPEGGKEVLREWTGALRKGREEFKKVMDDGFNKFEDFFAREKSNAE